MASESLSLPSNELIECHNCSCSCKLMNSASAATWNRTVKRRFEQFDNCIEDVAKGFDYSSVARVEIENECMALRETLSSQQQSIQELYTDLEEERNASSSAANEAMSMILRLQREKAELQMEARQFKQFAEEKMAHDQEELLSLEVLLYKREQILQSLICKVQSYKHKMLSFGFTEAEVEEGENGGDFRTKGLIENFKAQYEFPPYDYPPIKCNKGPLELDNDVANIEKYVFSETPCAREHLQDLEYRIYQLEKTPRSNQMDGEFSSTKNILEKVVVGQSPRQPRHIRRVSADSSSSFYGLVKETCQESQIENERPSSSFKKMDFFSYTEDYSNLRKMDNGSDPGDDTSDRVYTIDSIHNGAPNNSVVGPKAAFGICEDYVTTPRESLNRADTEYPDIKKLYLRLQALEADRESMQQAIISMGTDKAQLVLLREIAQNLCKEMSPERRIPLKKPSLISGFSIMSVLKWMVSSFIFWRKKAPRRSKYMFGISANNVGLLILLERDPDLRHWRCLTSTQL